MKKYYFDSNDTIRKTDIVNAFNTLTLIAVDAPDEEIREQIKESVMAIPSVSDDKELVKRGTATNAFETFTPRSLAVPTDTMSRRKATDIEMQINSLRNQIIGTILTVPPVTVAYTCRQCKLNKTNK